MSVVILPLLLIVAYFDLRHMRIPDRLTAAALVLFLLLAPALPWPELSQRILAGLVVFCLGAAVFSLRLAGGGDVKFLPALVLFVPAGTLTLFCYCLSLAILMAIITVTLLRNLGIAHGPAWAFSTRLGSIPLGLSFAYAGFGFSAIYGTVPGL